MRREEVLDPSLPEAPPIPRKIRLYTFQLIGVPLLLLIPILALVGFFGESFTEVHSTGEDLSIRVEYATRYRYKMENTMVVSVRNESEQELPLVTVEFSRNYVDQFSSISFIPSVENITAVAYEVALDAVQPGETRFVHLELQGEHYGRHTGAVSAYAEGRNPVQLEVSTIIFP